MLEPEAVDAMAELLIDGTQTIDGIQRRLSDDFELALKLIRDKTGRHRFFISRAALDAPQTYLEGLIRDAMKASPERSAPDAAQIQ